MVVGSGPVAVLFIVLFIVKNVKIWVYEEVKVLFLLENLRFVPNEPKTYYYYAP